MPNEDLILGKPISLNDQYDGPGFLRKRASNTICFGQVSLTFAILYVLYCKYPKEFRRLLFLYTLACDNLQGLRLKSYAIYFKEIEKELNKKYNKLEGRANGIFINEIFAFLIGHETMHACYRYNDEYKKKIVSYLDESILNDIPEGKTYREKYSFGIVPKAMTEKQKEECACDHISLKHLFGDLINKDISDEQLNELIDQILYTLMMQKYPANLDIMRNFSLKNGSISKHHNLQVAIMIRISYAAMVIQDLFPEKDLDLQKRCKRINKFSAKLMNGIVYKNSFKSIFTIIPDESQTLEEDLIQEANEIFRRLTNDIQNILLSQ